MKLATYTAIPQNMSDTSTLQSTWDYLGQDPVNLGIMSTMYPNLTVEFLTEGLGNTFGLSSKSSNKFQSLSTMSFQWQNEVSFIKTLELMANPIGDGLNGSPIRMIFNENYYQKGDIFICDDSKQQNLFVLNEPQRLPAGNQYEYVVQISNSKKALNPAIRKGSVTRFITNAHPEISDFGYTKVQSNIEKHREYLHILRNDVQASTQFEHLEDVFLKVDKSVGPNPSMDTYFRMTKNEQKLLTNFQNSKNQALLFDRTTMDEHGKCTLHDPATGQPIIIGNGVIAQIEQFATPYIYTKLTSQSLRNIVNIMVTKSSVGTGNKFMFVCNRIFYNQFNDAMQNLAQTYAPMGTYFYSQSKGGDVMMGAEFKSYNIFGNTISVQIDEQLHLMYPNTGYALFLDLESDAQTGRPAIMQFYLEGYHFKHNTILGVGSDQEIVSSKLSANTKVVTGTIGVGVFRPYRSVIIKENTPSN